MYPAVYFKENSCNFQGSFWFLGLLPRLHWHLSVFYFIQSFVLWCVVFFVCMCGEGSFVCLGVGFVCVVLFVFFSYQATFMASHITESGEGQI